MVGLQDTQMNANLVADPIFRKGLMAVPVDGTFTRNPNSDSSDLHSNPASDDDVTSDQATSSLPKLPISISETQPESSSPTPSTSTDNDGDSSISSPPSGSQLDNQPVQMQVFISEHMLNSAALAAHQAGSIILPHKASSTYMKTFFSNFEEVYGHHE